MPCLSRGLKQDQLTFGYLGRLDAFKWSALKPFIENTLASQLKNRRICLLAITDGPFAGEMRSLCDRLGIDLDMTGFLPNQQARDLIRDRVDIAVAMGTAALDMAAEGVPCLIIDPAFSLNAKPQQKFRFVHQSQDFTLGEFRDFPLYQSSGHVFDKVIEDIFSDETIREKSANYVADHHGPEAIFDKLLTSIKQSKVTAHQMQAMIAEINRSFERQASLFGLRRGSSLPAS